MGNASTDREEATQDPQAGHYRLPESHVYGVMRKQKADALKQEFSGDNDQADALDFMSPELLKESEQILDFLEQYLGSEITDYCLDLSHDLLDTEQGDLVRTLWFSRGMEDTFLCLTPGGWIQAMDPEMPMGLLANVANALEQLEESNGRQRFQED